MDPADPNASLEIFMDLLDAAIRDSIPKRRNKSQRTPLGLQEILKSSFMKNTDFLGKQEIQRLI